MRINHYPDKLMAILKFLAFDLGATSGRTILGILDTISKKLTTEELTRFPNGIINCSGRSYWNLLSLYESIKEGLRKGAAQGEITSCGIDTWGVDFVCFDESGIPLGNPRAYRDAALAGAPGRFFRTEMSAGDLYEKTGIQHLDFNTVFQLSEYRNTTPLRCAARILFMPDALSYMLTGNAVTEYTIASTGAVINAGSREIDVDILNAAGVRPEKFAAVVNPGTVVGRISEEMCRETGIGPVNVVAVAGHDTASAVAAIPAKDADFAYLSSGTWSLMGIETASPVINDVTVRENITNEGGVDGTIRLLKNITGMWILEQCICCWKREGKDYSYPEIVGMASGAPAFKAVVNPDDSCFTSPSDMLQAIRDYCRRTGQPEPQTNAEFIRTIFESLALKYRYVLNIFRSLSEHPVNRLHVIGGGSRNALLNQFTADAIGIPVVAGPAEASALGNIMLQAQSAGSVSGLREIRDILSANIETVTFVPRDTEAWNQAYDKFSYLFKNQTI